LCFYKKKILKKMRERKGGRETVRGRERGEREREDQRY
jgi:hypothetical protein